MRRTDLHVSRQRSRWIVALWMIQPLGILAEVVAAVFVKAPYSFIDNTISDLGAVSCTTIA